MVLLDAQDLFYVMSIEYICSTDYEMKVLCCTENVKINYIPYVFSYGGG